MKVSTEIKIVAANTPAKLESDLNFVLKMYEQKSYELSLVADEKIKAFTEQYKDNPDSPDANIDVTSIQVNLPPKIVVFGDVLVKEVMIRTVTEKLRLKDVDYNFTPKAGFEM